MKIRMLGIDHNRANLDIRSIFSFTKRNMIEALEELKRQTGIEGCLILSTCNRTEIWVQQGEAEGLDLFEFLCRLKGIEKECYRGYICEREDMEAIFHLFSLTCGLKSQILGEDQIITQVKDALEFARKQESTNSILEVLFRKAITAAKKVKSNVVFPKGNISVIHKAITQLQQLGYHMKGKVGMVIGNGQMGKGAAKACVDQGAHVMVTVRQYHHGMVQIPMGCKAIDYSRRKEYIPSCDFIISATTSPHHTLTKEMIGEVKRPLTLMDLAVPRDIEVACETLEFVTLYDIDDFKVDGKEGALYLAIRDAEEILKEYIKEFYDWLGGHEVMPRIRFVKDEVIGDLSARLGKTVECLDIVEEQKGELTNQIEQAADRVLSKLLFGLKDSLKKQEFLSCMEGLEQLYEK